jgi:hypothetical protein
MTDPDFATAARIVAECSTIKREQFLALIESQLRKAYQMGATDEAFEGFRRNVEAQQVAA